MGGNIIGALIFTIAITILIITGANLERRNLNQNILTNNIQLEASELKTFTNAAYNYTESLGISLSPSILTVSNFQSSGLLPATFPQNTPFGQTFQADYETDSCNSNVIDLLIKTTGNYNSDLLSKNGVSGTLGIDYINSNVDKDVLNMNLSFKNASNPCINGGQNNYIGYTNTTNFNIYGSGQIISSNYNSKNNDAGIYVYAPNQLGYELINASVYGYFEIWGAVLLNDISSLYRYGNWTINSQGYSMICPEDAINLGSVSSAGSIAPIYTDAPDSNDSQNITFCVPVYKSQTFNFNYNTSNMLQIINKNPVFSSAEWGGIYPNIYYTAPYVYYLSNSYWINPDSIAGLNETLYGIEGEITSVSPITTSPSADYVPYQSLRNIVGAQGFDIDVNGNVYQFAFWDYILWTGIGSSVPQLCNPVMPNQCYDSGATIWESGGSGSPNLGSSSENWGVGYLVNKNPSNSSEVPNAEITYRPNNSSPTTNTPFTIPTAVIN